ncbi:MAG: DoxX family protein [Betaproteobacteria bacterium]|nr:DoxX family protein [Betaproteobacteria bacterium]
MTGIESIAFLVARICTSGIWFGAGLYKATHFEKTAEEMGGHFGIPFPRLVLPVVVALELGGSAMLIANFYVWLACLAWIVFLFPATVLYHGKVITPEGKIDFLQYVMVFKNISILGGLIILILLDPTRPAWLLRA